jgi:GNAT superfamily N-acetyltransferase
MNSIEHKRNCTLVRPARNVDLARVREMAIRLFEETKERTTDEPALDHLDERKRELMEDVPADTTWVAEHEGKVCGFVTAVRDQGAVRIAALYVSLSQRHRGIGTKLVEAALNTVCSCVPVVVETLPDIHPFYARFGFEPNRDRPWLLNLKAKGEGRV